MLFARYGLPKVLITDNGPPFNAAEFGKLMEFCGTQHITSSPHFPQANGESERAVQVAKRILEQDDPVFALLNYRVTPHLSTGYSPAQLLMGRMLRSRVPMLEKNLVPKWPDSNEVRQNDNEAKTSYAYYYDKKHGARPLTTLSPGEMVRVKTDDCKTWSSPREVVVEHSSPRSYWVKNDQGKVQRRNRCQLQVIPDSPKTNGQSVNEPVKESSMSFPSTDIGEPARSLSQNESGMTSKCASPKQVTTTTRSGRQVKPVVKMSL
jgi:hypothetical protein